MAHRLLRDAQADGWERSDLPSVCGSCFGDKPYVRMMRAEYYKEYKICPHPFTVFHWRPGEMQVQVRDTALATNPNDAIPSTDVNCEYFAEEHDHRARAGIDYDSLYGMVRTYDTILKLQRTAPYYKRIRAHVCSFYVCSECTQGSKFPYWHEMPETGELSQQNSKDRYCRFGTLHLSHLSSIIQRLIVEVGSSPKYPPLKSIN